MDLSNISILNIMPPNIAADPNIRKIAEAFDEVLRGIIAKIPNVEVIPNLVLNRIVDETLIDLLAWQFHVDFYDPKLPIEIKRELVLKSLDWHTRKGTPSVVEEIVSTVFSRAKIEEWFEYGGQPYRFRIATEEQMPDAETVNKLIRAVNSVKNTRSFLETLTQMTDFFDEVITEDILGLIIARTKFSDSFNYSGLKFNGQIKHDGSHTAGRQISDRFTLILRPNNFVDVFETRLRHNGMIKADGSHKFNGIGRISDVFRMFINYGHTDNVDITEIDKIKIGTDLLDYFSTQKKFNGVHKHNGAIQASAARELFTLKIENAFVDTFYTALKHNGMIKADGSHKFNGLGRISDLVSIKGLFNFQENVAIDDLFSLQIKQRIGLKDYFPTRFRFDGVLKHNGQVTASGSREELRMAVKGINLADKHRSRLKHNGTIKADGSYKFDAEAGIGDILKASNAYKYLESINAIDGHTEKIALHLSDTEEVQEQPGIKLSMPMNDGVEIKEGFFIGKKHHRKHNGKHKANGNINFNSGVLIPV